MKVLLVGAGGREHALARALRRGGAELVVEPGNPALASLGQVGSFHGSDPQSVVREARRRGSGLVVVGPEAPLVAGVADAVQAAGVPCFGPTREAARLESSKSFAKRVMAAASVPTAQSSTCVTVREAGEALDRFGPPYVVKDDGLAAGKGVVVTRDRDEALAHARHCLGKPHGAVVVEEFLDGPEVSVFCVSDGSRVVPLAPAQDFKRLGAGGVGPNTGGMGAYSPLPWLPAGFAQGVAQTIARPTVDAMARRGTPFRGVLYCGLALTRRGVRVVEFNVRFGDPEAQVVLERLVSPLPELLYAAATGALDRAPRLAWSDEAAVTIVLASPGYPEAPRPGQVLAGIDAAEQVPGVHVIHAGTRMEIRGGAVRLVAAGGRVLDVVGRGADVAQARRRAREGVSRIRFPGAQWREDIATWPPDVLPAGWDATEGVSKRTEG